MKLFQHNEHSVHSWTLKNNHSISGSSREFQNFLELFQNARYTHVFYIFVCIFRFGQLIILKLMQIFNVYVINVQSKNIRDWLTIKKVVQE